VYVIVVMTTVDLGVSPHLVRAIQENWGLRFHVMWRGVNLVWCKKLHVYRSEMEQTEAASQNETSALPNNNFVIARSVIPISARILCQIIS